MSIENGCDYYHSCNDCAREDCLVNKQKAEIKRLKRRNGDKIIKIDKLEVKIMDLEKDNAELQKQVDELKERLQFSEEAWEEDSDTDLEDFYEQVVKGTAKEILTLIKNGVELNSMIDGEAKIAIMNELRWAGQKYGLEVE